jgi:hypothetical protein
VTFSRCVCIGAAGVALSLSGCSTGAPHSEVGLTETDGEATPSSAAQQTAATVDTAPGTSPLGNQDDTIRSTTNFGPVSQYSSPEPVRVTVNETEDGARFELSFRVQDKDGNGVSIDVTPYMPTVSEWSVNDGTDGGLGITVSGPSMDGPAAEAHALITYPDASSIRFDLSGVLIGHHDNPANPGEITTTSSVPDGFVSGTVEMTCVRLGAIVATGPEGIVVRESPSVDEDWSSEHCKAAWAQLQRN